MTNYEKHKDFFQRMYKNDIALDRITISGNEPVLCSDISCAECDFDRPFNCADEYKILEWCSKEAEE